MMIVRLGAAVALTVALAGCGPPSDPECACADGERCDDGVCVVDDVTDTGVEGDAELDVSDPDTPDGADDVTDTSDVDVDSDSGTDTGEAPPPEHVIGRVGPGGESRSDRFHLVGRVDWQSGARSSSATFTLQTRAASAPIE